MERYEGPLPTRTWGLAPKVWTALQDGPVKLTPDDFGGDASRMHRWRAGVTSGHIGTQAAAKGMRARTHIKEAEYLLVWLEPREEA